MTSSYSAQLIGVALQEASHESAIVRIYQAAEGVSEMI